MTDPGRLADWYAASLGVLPVPTTSDAPCWETDAGPLVFAPFPDDTAMFPATRFMLNFRVGDLDAMVAQRRAAGTTVEADPERYPNGRFASLADPEGQSGRAMVGKGGGGGIRAQPARGHAASSARTAATNARG